MKRRDLFAVGALAAALMMGGLVAAEGDGTYTGPLCTESATCICPEDEPVCVPGSPVAGTPEPIAPEAVEPVYVTADGEDIYIFTLPSTGTGATTK